MLRTVIAMIILVGSQIAFSSELNVVSNHNNIYVPSLITKSPYEGRILAIKLVRKTIGAIQTNGQSKMKVRAEYAEDAQLLMKAAELVAIEFKTIAIANNYWRDEVEQ